MANGDINEIQEMFRAIGDTSKSLFGTSDITSLDDKSQLEILEKMGIISCSEAKHIEGVWAAQNDWRRKAGF